MGSRLLGISKNYAKAEQRFEDILKNKLGRRTVRAVQTPRFQRSPMNFGSRVPADRQNVTHLSGATPAEIDAAFEGTALHGMGNAFVKAEKKHGVNAWFLASVATLESGYGTSKIARDKNNLFGFAAYDHAPYSSAKHFRTREEGVDYVADFLSGEYLNNDGRYFKGLSVDAVGKSYATDPNWADKVSVLMNQLSRHQKIDGSYSDEGER